ncbi:MAG: hypothetical protein ACQGVK_10950 [Myxococcota bacterium]
MAQPTKSPDDSDAAAHAGDAAETPSAGDAEIQPTPFDHPLFLPALFAAGCAWFGYDSYFNQDPGILEHLEFNRFGLRVVAYAAAFSSYLGFCELKERDPSPWFRPAVHALFAGWFAFDATLNSDPWYEPYREFNLHAAGALGLTALGLAVQAARAGQRGDSPPGFIMAGWVMFLAFVFGFRVIQGVDNGLIYGSTAAGLAALSIWITRRAWQRRRHTRASDATAPSP